MLVLRIAITVLSIAFGTPTRAPAFHQIGPGSAAAPKAKSWKGTTGDLSVDLKLEQFRDSVYARGTYRLGSKRRVGCGGESLSPQGYFTMRAKGTLNSFRGQFLFDSGWLPPVSGTRTASGTIKVDIRSVDRGKCVLILRKT